MEEYLTFANPELLDLNRLMLWTFIGGFVTSIILFAIWSMHHHKAYPLLSTIVSIISLSGLVVLYFLGPLYNNYLIAQSIADDYGVIVTDMSKDRHFVAANDNQLYSCSANFVEEKRYYAICDIKEERLLLDTIVADPDR